MMRPLFLSAYLLATLSSAAFCQTYSGPNGARPGNEVGTGASLPRSSRASNIGPQDTRSEIAPNLPSPPVAPGSRPSDFLRAAQGALAAGRTGEAQQSLEMAQTRMLDRSVPQGQTNNPSDNPAVAQVSAALSQLASGDRSTCMDSIQTALASATSQGL